MDKVIKEGTLRLLITESTCDVILSCSDHRLMAHKLVLSIASPVFRELLRKNSSDSTCVLILPDINSSTMSTILDYIYTGTTVVYSHALEEFLSVAKFLQIVIDTQNMENMLENLEYVKKHDKEDLIDCSNKTTLDQVNLYETKSQSKKIGVDDSLEKSVDSSPRKSQKTLPDLLPIIGAGMFKRTIQKKMCKVVVPSPWCRRDGRSFLGDPRDVSLGNADNELQKCQLEDTNNNTQLTHDKEILKHNPKSIDSVIRHLYLNNREIQKSKAVEDQGEGEADPKVSTKSYNVPVSNSSASVERLELPKFTNFPFSRHLADLLPFGSKYLQDTKIPDYGQKLSDNTNSMSCRLNLTKGKYSCDEPSTSALCSDGRKKIRSDNAKISCCKNSSSFTQLSPTYPHELPCIPSSINPSRNLPPMPQLNREKERLCNDAVSSSNDSFASVHNAINDNSNDNSVNSDSSIEEKKEAEDHVRKKSFKCDECGKTFSQLRNFKYHRSVHEGTKEFSAKCSECGKTFNDRGYLSSHMKIHRDRKEYACPNCPKRFNQRVAYNMHLRIHTGVKPHECPTCGKSFSRKMLLKQHQRVHTGERPYSCPECGKTFADRSNMSLHARLHTGVKPYACSVCPKSFTKKHHLKTHMNFHTGLKPYTCENCGLAFSQSSNMRTHYKKCVLKDKLGSATKTESLSSADNNSS